MHVREAVESQPDEPGWWLASDGKWYPPERPPMWTPPVGAPQRRRIPPQLGVEFDAFAIALVGLASIAASWLIMGWDLSEIDSQGHKIDQTISPSRFVVGLVLLLGAIVVASWTRPSSWMWIAGAAAVGIEFWYTWRGYSSRTEGANMTGVGTVFLLGPVGIVTLVPAWVTSALALRSRRRRETP
jgi:hypothetical protein